MDSMLPYCLQRPLISVISMTEFMLAIVPQSLTIKCLHFLHKKPNKQFLTTDYAHDIVPGSLPNDLS